MSKRILCDCEVLEKKWLNPSYYTLRFLCPEIAKRSRPGQFINVKFSEHFEPLLRRPMSIFSANADEGWLEVLIKVVGKGTAAFSKAVPGEKFSILGPLGNGFSYHDSKKAILVGGGIGIAPLIFLAEELKKLGVPVWAFFGFRSAAEMCCISQLENRVNRIWISTDDGSYGTQGVVVDSVAAFLAETNEWAGATVFACGPNVMMASLERICTSHDLPAQFSLEAHMACGFGACVGCAVPTKDNRGYVLVCEQGPVFQMGEVNLGS